MSAQLDSSSCQTVWYEVEAQFKIVGDAWGSPENPAILFAHGGGQTRHAWKNTARLVAQQDWYSIAIDLRGHGESDWHPQGDYKIEAFAADLRVIASTFTQKPVLVGASLGGLAGLIAEGESTHSVFSAVILVDVAHRHEDKGTERILSFMNELIKKGFADMNEAVATVAAYLPHRAVPDDVSGLEKNLRSGEDGRYYWHWDPQFIRVANELKQSRDYNRLTDAARALQIPTLLIRGHMSDVLSQEAAKEFLDLVPQAEFADVRDAGHMIAGDRNDIFSDAVVHFLRKLRQ